MKEHLQRQRKQREFGNLEKELGDAIAKAVKSFQLASNRKVERVQVVFHEGLKSPEVRPPHLKRLGS